MPRRLNPNATSWMTLALACLICFCFWNWTERILAPAKTLEVLASGKPLGNHSDLYPRWLGTRELFLRGRNPYSIDVTREIQSGFYGVPLSKVDSYEPSQKEAFLYPLYVSFFLSPTIRLSFTTVQQISRWLLLLAIPASVPLWMCAIAFRPRVAYVLAWMVLAASSSPAIVEFHQQNLAALAVFFLAAASALVARNCLVFGGILLALATIKPDTAGPVVLWFLFWAASGWKQRKRLIGSFAAALSVLSLAALAFCPLWIADFLSAVSAYPSYGSDPTILQLILPLVAAKVISGLLVLALALLCWRWRDAPAGSKNFNWTLISVATMTVVLLPRLAPYNQSLLVPAWLMLMERSQRIWNSGMLARAAMGSAFACQAWQWTAAAFLTVSGFLQSTATLRPFAGIPNYAALSLPLLTLLAVVLGTSSLSQNDSLLAATTKR